VADAGTCGTKGIFERPIRPLSRVSPIGFPTLRNRHSAKSLNLRKSAVKALYSHPFVSIRGSFRMHSRLKMLGICSATDLDANTERLGTWLRFPPVCSQFRRELH
jgi:hypothetical protein